jgi:hypothetical protein
VGRIKSSSNCSRPGPASTCSLVPAKLLAILMPLSVSIETITPDQAEDLLKKNFASNRKVSLAQVNRLKESIAKDLFYCSSDAIAIDENGYVVNGQHRLTAVAASNKCCQFLVVRDFPRNHVKCLDIGKKRTISDRITVDGQPITTANCAITRNCFSDYKNSNLGTVIYSKLHHDPQVREWYQGLKKYLSVIEDLKWQNPGACTVAAVYIIADEANKQIRYQNDARFKPYADKAMSPLVRSLQFLEYTVTGEMDLSGSYIKDRDGSAKTVYDGRMHRKAQGKYWNTFEQFNITMNLASNFAELRHTKKLNSTQRRPFSERLDNYKYTVDACVKYCLDNHMEKIKEHFDSKLIAVLCDAYSV